MLKIKEQETGRSMVEMLGVLAVIGVLSVAGVAGYTRAMNKHRANEILNEASKRAVMVAGQLLTNPSATSMSLAQFWNNTVAGATFGANATIADGKITLTASGVESAICEQMKAATGDNTVMTVTGDCGSTLTLTFKTDMSKGSGSGTSELAACNPACNECEKCESDSCVRDVSKNGTSCNSGAGVCHLGKCETNCWQTGTCQASDMNTWDGWCENAPHSSVYCDKLEENELDNEERQRDSLYAACRSEGINQQCCYYRSWNGENYDCECIDSGEDYSCCACTKDTGSRAECKSFGACK